MSRTVPDEQISRHIEIESSGISFWSGVEVKGAWFPLFSVFKAGQESHRSYLPPVRMDSRRGKSVAVSNGEIAERDLFVRELGRCPHTENSPKKNLALCLVECVQIQRET